MGPLAQLEVTTTTGEAGTSLHFEVSDAHGWMLAHWALALANQFGVVEVSYAGHKWDRNANADGHNVGWRPIESTVEGQLTIVLATAPADG